MLRKIFAMTLIVIGAAYGPGAIVGFAFVLILPGLWQTPVLMLSIYGVEAIVCTGLLLAGMALWGWRRWRKILGVALTVIGAVAGFLVLNGLVLWAMLRGQERDFFFIFAPTAPYAGILLGMSSAIFLVVGIRLIRAQRRLDRAGAANPPASSAVPNL